MSTTATPPSPFIDWHSLWVVFGTSLVVGVGIVLLFTIGVHSLSTYRRQGSSTIVRSLNGFTMAVVSAAIAATVVWGLYFIVHK
jgi:hypothetical protein